jgi:hypothetical protein
VTISLKNQGEEAYKPKEYGKSIVITRRFSKEGSSSWKIKSKDGRIISTKKDELSAICDHMNIQVDNPMNVLTQGESSACGFDYMLRCTVVDAARQFLSASHPNDKYKARQNCFLCLVSKFIPFPVLPSWDPTISAFRRIQYMPR